MGERQRGLGPWWLVAGVVVVAIGVGLAIGFVLTQDDDDASLTAADAEPSAEATEAPPEPSVTPDATEVPESESPEPTDEPATESTPEPTPEPTSAGSFDISDETIEAAMAEAAANPAEDPVLANRNELATAALNNEFADSGFDLGGLEMIVYAAEESEDTGEETHLLVIASDDSAALLSGDTDSELFVTQLLSSPAIAQFSVERLVLQHSGVDDEGPFVMTITLLFTDLEEAAAGTVDVFDRATVQMERG